MRADAAAAYWAAHIDYINGYEATYRLTLVEPCAVHGGSIYADRVIETLPWKGFDKLRLRITLLHDVGGRCCMQSVTFFVVRREDFPKGIVAYFDLYVV